MAGLPPTSSLTQPAYLQGVSTYNPSSAAYAPVATQYANTSTLDPNLVASLNPSATIAQIQQAYLPQEQQATQNLNQTLADFGVSGGQAVQANQQLQGLLASSIAPALASAIQNAQGLQLNAGQFNAGAQNAGSQFNAGLGTNTNMNNAQNALSAALANASAANNAAQFGATATNQMNAANVGQFNQTPAQMLQDILNNYNAQMGINAGIYGQGQGAGNQQALNFGQDITVSDPFAQIFGAAANAAPYLIGAPSNRL